MNKPITEDEMRDLWLNSIPPQMRNRDTLPPSLQPEQPRLNGISAEKRAEIIRLRKAGMTYKQIAAKVGCAVNTAVDVGKGLNVENPRLARLRKRREALLPEVLRLHAGGLTGQQIGERFGVSREAVNRWIREAQA